MYRLNVCLASCAVHAGVRVLCVCKGTFQCCMHGCVRARVRFSVSCMGVYVRVFVSACVRVSVARQHACVCTCQCCTPTCVRVLRACMCTCGVRLHVSRLTFSSLVIRFSSRWIQNQGPPVYHQTPTPLSCQPPPAEPPPTAGPRRHAASLAPKPLPTAGPPPHQPSL